MAGNAFGSIGTQNLATTMLIDSAASMETAPDIQAGAHSIIHSMGIDLDTDSSSNLEAGLKKLAAQMEEFRQASAADDAIDEMELARRMMQAALLKAQQREHLPSTTGPRLIPLPYALPDGYSHRPTENLEAIGGSPPAILSTPPSAIEGSKLKIIPGTGGAVRLSDGSQA
jgi:hypothetical protein